MCMEIPASQELPAGELPALSLGRGETGEARKLRCGHLFIPQAKGERDIRARTLWAWRQGRGVFPETSSCVCEDGLESAAR